MRSRNPFRMETPKVKVLRLNGEPIELELPADGKVHDLQGPQMGLKRSPTYS